LAKRRTGHLSQLATRLGHDFGDPALLKLALTHASAHPGSKPNEDNERLEFLGDRVLGLAVAEFLSERFPEASEGELARWFNQLVRTESCAEVGQSWDLGEFILMSGGEAGSGGRQKKTILANACEALLGAVFVDAGYEIAREGPDHAPRFTAEVRVEGMPPEQGEGTNKRQAEQAAALAMLLREGVWRPADD